MVINDENTIRAEEENNYKNNEIMETRNVELLFSWFSFGRRKRKKGRLEIVCFAYYQFSCFVFSSVHTVVGCFAQVMHWKIDQISSALPY